MKKIIVTAVASISLLANVASAQSYYPTYGTSAACVTINRDLSVGSRGTDVSTLQNLLVAQNYPGAGSWMVTGYFGAATQAAVRNFQSQHNLAQTGVADASTRASMANCLSGQGGVSNSSYTPFNNNNNYNYNNNSVPFSQYPYNNQYQSSFAQGYGGTQYNYNQYPNTYGSVPVLTSLSVTSATPGSSVTVYGTGFDYSSNTVYVGGTTLSGIASYGGTSLTFIVPQTMTGTVSVSVGNSRGVSNALTLNMTYSPYGCGTYGYNYGNCGGCAYGTDCSNQPLTLTYLTPNQGGVGQIVTVYGTGFSRTNNSVNFGNGIIASLSSFDGTSVTFTVPSQLSGYGYQPIGLGTYNVSVTNSVGRTSNTLPFTITSLNSSGSPSISNISGPTTLSTGVTGVWSASVNTMNNTYTSMSVRWGDENLYGTAATAPQTLSLQGTQTFTFSHSYAQAGTYTITFTISNNSGQQNTATATVTVTTGGTTGNITLSYLSPQSGRVGTQVMLTGSGFSQYDNTVHFGNGGSMHVPSYNGTTIYYTVPSYLTPCDITSGSGVVCPMYAQQVTPGTYPMYVTSSQGTTNTLNFTVTQ